MNITTKKVLAYTFMPQVAPRFRTLMSGFTFIAFFLAQVYRAVGLLPKGHPYLNGSNIGRFGITHVISEAGMLLKRRGASIDQIIVYWALMLGLVVLAGQMVLLMLGIFVGVAHAGAIGVNTNFFITNNPNDDLAFMLMDRVFGVPDLFNSCVSTNAVCLDSSLAANSYWNNTARSAVATAPFPSPFSAALRSGFQLYSVALLCISALILCYFVFAILAETAESGTPFGRRFNKVWAPLRLVAAIGMLIPIANGLNAAQYITLYAAKFGSGFATNGWNLFVATAVGGDNTLMGPRQNLVAVPNAPPVNTLLSFFAVVSTCKEGIEDMSDSRNDTPRRRIRAYQINPMDAAQRYRPASWNYTNMIDYAGQGAIIIRFGEHPVDPVTNMPTYTSDASNIAPTCGELIFPITNTDPQQAPGARHIMRTYTSFVQNLWNEVSDGGFGGSPLRQIGYGMVSHDISSSTHYNADAPLPSLQDMIGVRDDYQNVLQTALTASVTDQLTSTAITNSAAELTQYGWAGAGIWFNRIAQINGSLVAALNNLPMPSKMPAIMQEVQLSNLQTNRDTSGPNTFNPFGANGQDFVAHLTADQQLAYALSQTYDYWSESNSTQNVSANIFIDAINAIFGTAGLFNMHENQQRNIHPLAQLATAGRGILESAVRNLGAAGAAGLGGGLMNIESPHLAGTVGMAVSGFLWSIALTGLSIGFVLFYIVPFLPFMYFFFAVGSWVKTIFEAMVGVPLWALAHLRIDGNGLPGDAAMGGYFLLLDIFLRPILIIFGMIGSILIFSAQASVLNDIWSLVTSNIAGFDRDAAGGTAAGTTGALEYMRDSVDQMFFSVMYAIMIYMLGTSSFKLVDQVPSYILRWMGANVQTFSDHHGEHPAEHLLRNSFAGTQSISDVLSQSSPSALGNSISGAGQAFARRNANS